MMLRCYGKNSAANASSLAQADMPMIYIDVAMSGRRRWRGTVVARGTIPKIPIETQWDGWQQWDTISY